MEDGELTLAVMAAPSAVIEKVEEVKVEEEKAEEAAAPTEAPPEGGE
jgi:hypothetical protein